MPDVSIIILTKNGEDQIGSCLEGVFRQKTKYFYEVIVVDSGSTDNTVKIAKEFDVQLIKIKPEEFGHGKTRNLGARLAKGLYLVYLTQDAIPAHEYWLDNLVGNLEEDENIAGVYSRWFPKPDCNPLERREITELFKPIKETRDLNKICKEKFLRNIKDFILFSNVSSSIRKQVWEKIPFNDMAIFAEDQEWCTSVLLSGYTIVYEPTSVVFHSHNHSFKLLFQRSFDSGVAFKQFTGKSIMRVKLFLLPFLALYEVCRNYFFMRKNKIKIRLDRLLYPALAVFARGIGGWLGQHYKKLPSGLKKR